MLQETENNEKWASEESVTKEVVREKSKSSGRKASSTSVDELILPSLDVNCHFHLLPLLLCSVAFATRFYALDEPHHIVFDELHYGRYASLYLKRTFFFDSHPPLGKQLLALAAYTAGFDGTVSFYSSGVLVDFQACSGSRKKIYIQLIQPSKLIKNRLEWFLYQ